MKLLKHCTQMLSFGCSEDALIHCFKEKSACSSGATKLKEALQILPDESSEEKFLPIQLTLMLKMRVSLYTCFKLMKKLMI